SLPPTLTVPTGAPGTLRRTVTWNAVNGATAYQVRVDDQATGTPNLFPNALTTGSSWAPPSDLVSGRGYTVLVRALRGTAPGPWSSPNAFRPATPTATGPGATVAALRPTLSWTGVAGASYQVRVNDPVAGRTN